MSKIALKSAEAGTATFTIEAPATNTDRIFELPDEAGKILTDVGVPTSAMPTGSVLQVVQGTTSTGTTTTSASFSDTGLQASISPNNANNKILVSISQPFFSSREREFAALFGLKLFRDSTEIVYISEKLGITAQKGDEGGKSMFDGVINYSYIDSPSSTSELTYKTQFNNRAGGSQNSIAGVNRDSDGNSYLSTIILMEIAG